MKRIPLHEEHIRLGGKLVEFAGFQMPVQYNAGIIKEHLNVRQKAGLFDISHMGELLVEGKDATSFLQKVMVNDLKLLYDGKAQYSTICAENGGTIEDTFYYRHNMNKYRLIINASNRNKDIQWLNSHIGDFEVIVKDVSDYRGRFALQGPLSEDILNPHVEEDLSTLQRFHFLETKLNDKDVFIARTGYTGEDGFEISFKSEHSLEIWRFILEIGEKFSILPIGLGARDTLRLEACYSLYGHELTIEITPVEAGIGWVVKEKEENFIGKDVLLSQKKNGTSRKIVGIELADKGVLRENFEILHENVKIGYITSGTFSPLFKKSIALAMVDIDHSEIGSDISINIRGRIAQGLVVKTPFYVYKKK